MARKRSSSLARFVPGLCWVRRRGWLVMASAIESAVRWENRNGASGPLRKYTEEPLRQGAIQRPWDRLVAGLILGSESFARKLRQSVRANPREQPSLKGLTARVTWEQILAALEKFKGETWAQFSQRYGDWGRDAALWLGRRRGRYRLAELGQLAGGMDYAAVGQAVSRFARRLERDGRLRRQIAKMEKELYNVET